MAPRPVLILHEAIAADARADELDALVQVREVSEALHRLGVDTVTRAIGLDLECGLRDVRRQRPCCVFNLVESLGGRGELIGVVPSLLRAANIPFTGSDADAMQLSSHKINAKRLMASSGIATPAWFTAAGGPRDQHERWIVKSIWEHASFGLDDSSVVRGHPAARRVMARRKDEFGGQWFAERYIEGREFNVALLERAGKPEVLPIAEMTFVDYPPGRPKIVGYAAKWIESTHEYRATQRVYPRLAPELSEALQAAALQCWDLFGLGGYARVDFRLDANNLPWVLEVNANPCLAGDAGFAAAGAAAGLPYDSIVERLLHAALPAGRDALKRAV
jgi:D-alanine-D-alanine ligase